MNERWIVIPRWDDFQHRDMARSTVPPWIKTYTKLMGDNDFRELSFHLRGVLVSIWLEYAVARRQLSGSTVALTRRLGHRVTRANLETLNHAGFIEFSASRPASAPASLEVEVEVENKDLGSSSPTSNGNGAGHEFAAKVVAASTAAPATPAREYRNYDPPADPVATIRRLITNGAIADHVDLDVEMRAHQLTDEQRDELRALLPEPESADDIDWTATT